MKKIILLIISILLLTGCKSENKECIKSHTEEGTCTRPLSIIVNGKPTVILTPYNCEKTICDEYKTID